VHDCAGGITALAQPKSEVRPRVLISTDIAEDSVCMTATIDKQQWAGYYLGNGEYVLRYCPKAPARLTYTITSPLA